MGGGKSKAVKTGADLQFDPKVLPPRHAVSADERKTALEGVAAVVATKRIDYVGTATAPAGKDNDDLISNLVLVLKHFPEASLTIQCATGGNKKHDFTSEKRGAAIKAQLLAEGISEHFPMEVVVVKDKFPKAEAKKLPVNGFVRFALAAAAKEYDPFEHLESVTARKANRILVNKDYTLEESSQTALREICIALRDVPLEVLIRSCDYEGNADAAGKRAEAVHAQLAFLGLSNPIVVVTESPEAPWSMAATQSEKHTGYKVAVTFLTDAERQEMADAAEAAEEAQRKLEEETKRLEMEPIVVEGTNPPRCGVMCGGA